MLTELSIRDIVLIERLDLQFNSGLSVLTGETGAGKSILLDGLSLALGGRGDGSLVRSNAKQGSVTAVFELPPAHGVTQLLKANDIPDEATLILRRIQKADGRTRAFINDAPVSATLIRQIGHLLVEIHGQHDDRAMLDTQTHRQLLDAFAGCSEEAAMVTLAWKTLKNAQHEVAVLRQRIEHAKKEADFLRASVDELFALAPQPGEETELADQRRRMMSLEQIASDLEEANTTLSGTASPIPVLASLTRRLARKQEQVPELLDETISQLDDALISLYAAQNSLETVINQSEFDPNELERAEERLFALRAASRKYSVAVESLPDLTVKLADDLEELDAGESRLEELEAARKRLEAEYFLLAEKLSTRRKQAAKALVEAVENELPALKLEAAKFLISHSSEVENAGPDGIDLIEFQVQTNPGTNPGPMTKVASGGELSRFMLALKVALAEKGSAPTLIFDEIDTGVGGAVADAIGRRLERLSTEVQVLSVTHAPQVAARAGNHYLISKEPVEDENRVTTRVEPVSSGKRREEIARMLAGATITDEARAAAEQLLGQSAA